MVWDDLCNNFLIILLLQLWQNEISWEFTVMYLVFWTLKYISVLSMSCNVVQSWCVLIPHWLMDMNKQFTWTTIDYRVKVSQIWRQRCGKYWGNGELSKYWQTLQWQVHFDLFFRGSIWVKNFEIRFWIKQIYWLCIYVGHGKWVISVCMLNSFFLLTCLLWNCITIGLDTGLVPIEHQTIIYTNGAFCLIRLDKMILDGKKILLKLSCPAS